MVAHTAPIVLPGSSSLCLSVAADKEGQMWLQNRSWHLS